MNSEKAHNQEKPRKKNENGRKRETTKTRSHVIKNRKQRNRKQNKKSGNKKWRNDNLRKTQKQQQSHVSAADMLTCQ